MKTCKWIIVLGLILLVAAPVAGKGPGGGGEIPDTGELYGDLYVILRDEGGVPMLDDYGCIQPISSTNGTVILDTYGGGTLTIEALEGEPFTLATYTDTAGDLVECELTEAMAEWAQAVDFGRLNLGRSPDDVINHAFDEAIKNMNLATAIETDPVGRLVLTIPDAETGEDTVKTIDSPAENLALYIKMMKDGHWITLDTTVDARGRRPPDKGPPEGDGPSTEPRPELSDEAVALLPSAYVGLGDEERTNADLTNDELLLAASLLAAAADKTGNITLDKLVYINSVYGINQAGSLPGEVEGKTYFNFGNYEYDRAVFGNRSSGTCESGLIWVLQPDDTGYEHFTAQCMEILGYDPNDETPVNAVRFTDMAEAYTTVFDGEGEPLAYDFTDNVRAFAQASDDALQVLEYIHNYKVPEAIYPTS